MQATLADMVAAGADAAVLEASSHALALERVRSVAWDVAVWTHLSSEHLDFHGTLENYFADKRRLVEAAPFAVLNVDDPGPRSCAASPRRDHLLRRGAARRLARHRHRGTQHGLHFHVISPLGEFDAHLPMIGRFNVANALAAMAAAAHLGADWEALVAGLASFRGVPGRMELVPDTRGRRVVVDFAHTPPASRRRWAPCAPPRRAA